MRRTRVEQNQAVCADEVDTTSTGFATKQEDKLLPIRVVKLIDQLLPFVDRHGAVQTEVAVPQVYCQFARTGVGWWGLTSCYATISRIDLGSAYSC